MDDREELAALRRLAELEAKAGSSQSAAGAANAVGTGFFRGMVGGLAGLPVDTVANVRDLLKAGAGSAYIAATDKAPPSWLEINPREQDIGSGASILKAVRKTAPGRFMVDPANPAYEGGYLQRAGAAGASVMGAKTGLQAANQAALGQLGAAGSKAAFDLTGSHALEAAMAMAPTGAQQAATAGVKAAVRGGEAGRRDMAQRTADLQAAGVKNPTLGLASGNQMIGGLENLLQNTPGAVGIMRRSRDEAVQGLQDKVTGAANMASTNRGSIASGQSIQAGAKTFKDSFKDRQTILYDRLDAFIGKQTPVPVPETTGTLGKLNADIPGAPALSKQFKNARIQAIDDAMRADVKASSGGGSLPFDAVKKTRSLVGGEIADNSLMSDVPRSKWNPLYAALSEDIRGAAKTAGPGATRAFNHANDYTRSGIGRMERIAPIVDRPAAEQSFGALKSTLKDNVTTFQAVKKSLPEGARGDFAGTIIERLGIAKPGQQDATGGKWSPETFLTNWTGISAKGRAELLSGFPNAAEIAQAVDKVANATAMMRDNSKMWANPSGTAANAAARGILGTVAAGGVGSMAGLLNPMIPLGAATGIGGVNALARGVTSPNVRNAMLRPTTLDPELLNALILQQISTGQLQNQPR